MFIKIANKNYEQVLLRKTNCGTESATLFCGVFANKITGYPLASTTPREWGHLSRTHIN